METRFLPAISSLVGVVFIVRSLGVEDGVGVVPAELDAVVFVLVDDVVVLVVLVLPVEVLLLVLPVFPLLPEVEPPVLPVFPVEPPVVPPVLPPVVPPVVPPVLPPVVPPVLPPVLPPDVPPDSPVLSPPLGFSASVTVTVHSAVLPPSSVFTVIFAVPLPTAVTFPL